MSTFIIFSETLAYDFQYEYAPFAKEQIYTRKAQDENGILREYNIIGVFTCRYTTERDNYYRRTAVCNVLRLKTNDSRAEKSKPKWKQKLIDWIEGI